MTIPFRLPPLPPTRDRFGRLTQAGLSRAYEPFAFDEEEDRPFGRTINPLALRRTGATAGRQRPIVTTAAPLSPEERANVGAARVAAGADRLPRFDRMLEDRQRRTSERYASDPTFRRRMDLAARADLALGGAVVGVAPDLGVAAIQASAEKQAALGVKPLGKWETLALVGAPAMVSGAASFMLGGAAVRAGMRSAGGLTATSGARLTTPGRIAEELVAARAAAQAARSPVRGVAQRLSRVLDRGQQPGAGLGSRIASELMSSTPVTAAQSALDSQGAGLTEMYANAKGDTALAERARASGRLGAFAENMALDVLGTGLIEGVRTAARTQSALQAARALRETAASVPSAARLVGRDFAESLRGGPIEDAVRSIEANLPRTSQALVSATNATRRGVEAGVDAALAAARAVAPRAELGNAAAGAAAATALEVMQPDGERDYLRAAGVGTLGGLAARRAMGLSIAPVANATEVASRRLIFQTPEAAPPIRRPMPEGRRADSARPVDPVTGQRRTNSGRVIDDTIPREVLDDVRAEQPERAPFKAYSKAERLVEGFGAERAGADTWMKRLRAMPKAEREWLDLDNPQGELSQVLQQAKLDNRSVDKVELLEVMARRGARVEEATFGESGRNPKRVAALQARASMEARMNELAREAADAVAARRAAIEEFGKDSEQARLATRAHEEVRARRDALDQEYLATEQQLLATMPLPAKYAEWRIAPTDELVEAAGMPERLRDMGVLQPRSNASTDTYREVSLSLDPTARRTKVAMVPDKDHFEVRDQLLHVRMEDFDAGEGRKGLYVHEIQSDTAQQGRVAGYGRTLDEIDELTARGRSLLQEQEQLASDRLSEARKRRKEQLIAEDPVYAGLEASAESLYRADRIGEEMEDEIGALSRSLNANMYPDLELQFSRIGAQRLGEYAERFEEAAREARSAVLDFVGGVPSEGGARRAALRALERQGLEGTYREAAVAISDVAGEAKAEQFAALFRQAARLEEGASAGRALAEAAVAGAQPGRRINIPMESVGALRRAAAEMLDAFRSSTSAHNRYAGAVLEADPGLAAAREEVRTASKALRNQPPALADNQPFKDTADWVRLGLKRVIDEAVQGGYDEVRFTTDALQKRMYGDAAPTKFYSSTVLATLQKYSREHGLNLVLDHGRPRQQGDAIPTALDVSPGFRVTPELRALVQQGQPLFALGMLSFGDDKDAQNGLRQLAAGALMATVPFATLRNLTREVPRKNKAWTSLSKAAQRAIDKADPESGYAPAHYAIARQGREDMGRILAEGTVEEQQGTLRQRAEEYRQIAHEMDAGFSSGALDENDRTLQQTRDLAARMARGYDAIAKRIAMPRQQAIEGERTVLEAMEAAKAERSKDPVLQAWKRKQLREGNTPAVREEAATIVANYLRGDLEEAARTALAEGHALGKWYDEAVQEAQDIAVIAMPELANPHLYAFFNYVSAVMSNGNPVTPEFAAGLTVMQQYLRTGRLSVFGVAPADEGFGDLPQLVKLPDGKDGEARARAPFAISDDGDVLAGGPRYNTWQNGLENLQAVLDRAGGDPGAAMRELWDRGLSKAGQRFVDARLDEGKTWDEAIALAEQAAATSQGKELQSLRQYGVYANPAGKHRLRATQLLGPKIGQYGTDRTMWMRSLATMKREFPEAVSERATNDLWMARGYNLAMGEAPKKVDDGKLAVDDTVDEFMRDVLDMAQIRLGEEVGVAMQGQRLYARDVQALLWESMKRKLAGMGAGMEEGAFDTLADAAVQYLRTPPKGRGTAEAVAIATQAPGLRVGAASPSALGGVGGAAAGALVGGALAAPDSEEAQSVLGRVAGVLGGALLGSLSGAYALHRAKRAVSDAVEGASAATPEALAARRKAANEWKAATIAARGSIQNPAVAELADRYRRVYNVSGQTLAPVEEMDEAFHREVAAWFDAAQATPDDPVTRQAYRAFARETKRQYDLAVKAGYTFDFTSDDPYANSAELLQDVWVNKRMRVFDSGADFQHAHLSREENNQFRAVHDLFGHALNGHQFGPKGEENAFREHAGMFSPEARSVLATETRGQNSWVNYGPHGEANRADPTKTQYAEQKTMLTPAKFAGGYPRERRGAANPAVLGAVGGAAAGTLAGAAIDAQIGVDVDLREGAMTGLFAGVFGGGAAALRVSRGLLGGKKTAQLTSTSPAVAQVFASIVTGARKAKPPTGLLSPAEQQYAALFDDAYAIRKFGREFNNEATGEGLDAQTRVSRRYVTWTSEYMREKLAPVLQAAKGREADVMVRVKAQRALQFLDNGQIEKTDLGESVLRQAMADTSDPETVAAAGALQDYYRGLLELRLKEGLIDRDAYDALIASEDFYTPFVREWDTAGVNGAGAMAGLSGGNFSNRGSGVRKMDREAIARAKTVDPFEMAALDTSRLWQQIGKQRVAQRMVSIIEAHGGNIPGVARIVPSPQQQVTMPNGAVVTKTVPVSRTPTAATVPMQINGRQIEVELLDEDLFNAWQSWGPIASGPVARFLGAVKEFKRAAITTLPDFAIRNLLRDNAQVAMQSTFNAGRSAIGTGVGAAVGGAMGMEGDDTDWLRVAAGALAGSGIGLGGSMLLPQLARTMRGVTDIMAASDGPLTAIFGETLGGDARIWRQFLKDGGASLGNYARDTQTAVDLLKRLRGEKAAIYNPMRWWEAMNTMGEVLENAPRLATYKSAIAQGEGRMQAAARATDVSLDFSLRGGDPTVRGAIGAKAFLNARLQGWDKVARMLTKKEGYAMGFATITAPSLGIWLANHKDEETREAYYSHPSWIRNTFWLVPRGDGEHVYIPKPFELGVLFGSVPERALDWLYTTYYRGDARPGESAKRTAMDLATQLLGAELPIPDAVGPLLEQGLNYDMFRNRPIVSGETFASARKVPEAQIGFSTSYGAKKAAELLSTRTVPISPERLEHGLRAYGGSVAALALRITNYADPAAVDTPTVPIAGDLAKGFLDRRGAVSDDEETLRQRLDQVKRVDNTLNREAKIWGEAGEGKYSEAQRAAARSRARLVADRYTDLLGGDEGVHLQGLEAADKLLKEIRDAEFEVTKNADRPREERVAARNLLREWRARVAREAVAGRYDKIDELARLFAGDPSTVAPEEGGAP